MTPDPTKPTGDWTPEQLKAFGTDTLDRICRHFAALDDVPVTTPADAADVADAIDSELPSEATDFADILDDTWNNVVPHLTHWNHPRFHAYFSNSSSGPAILAEMTAAALNVNVMLWKSAPSAAAVEDTVTRWLAELLDYPAVDALLVDGASLGTFYALAAARHRAQPEVRHHGTSGEKPGRIYTSDQAHSSVDKAAIALGIGLDNVVRLPAGANGQLDPAALSTRIGSDVADGYTPIAVVATVGTTTSGALDPVEAIAAVCRDHRVWLHVDAAYGGFWRIAPAIAQVLPSLAAADSLVANPHKVLFTPMECGALFCRHPGALEAAFTLVPEYLRTDTTGSIDYMNYTLNLGRQFRALKLWWTLRAFGIRGIRTRLEHSLTLATRLRDALAADPRWHLANDSPLPLLCLRISSADGQATRKILETVNSTHRTLLSHSELDGHYVIRVSIGNIHTTADHIDQLVAELTEAADAVVGTPRPLASVTVTQQEVPAS